MLGLKTVFRLTHSVFVSFISDFTCPSLSVKSICSAPGRRCWPVSLCKPPSTSTMMSPTQRRSRRKTPSSPPCSGRRWPTAQRERPETGQTWQSDPGASMGGVHPLALAPLRLLPAPHACKSVSPAPARLTRALGTALRDSRPRTLRISTGHTRTWLSLASTPPTPRTRLLLILL